MSNIERYRNFLQIIESGSISAASKILCIAQPALSNQIKNLETEFGTQLFKRGARSLKLTNAGEIVYKKAKTICYLDDAIHKEINGCIAGNRGTLWLGLTPAYPDPVISELLLDFHDAYPDINFEIYEDNSPQLVEYLKNGIIEIGVIRTPTFVPPALEAYISIEEHLMVVYNRNNRWLSPDLESVPLTSLEGVPLCVSKGFRKKITDSCLENGFSPSLLSVSASRGTALMWARRGTAVSIIVSQSTEDQETDSLCCRRIHGKDMSTRRSFAFYKERPLSSVGKVFLNFCEARKKSISSGYTKNS